MANTVSAKKMTRKIAKRTAINKSRRSRVRTFVRKVEEALASGNKTDAAAALRAARTIDFDRRIPIRPNYHPTGRMPTSRRARP